MSCFDWDQRNSGGRYHETEATDRSQTVICIIRQFTHRFPPQRVCAYVQGNRKSTKFGCLRSDFLRGYCKRPLSGVRMFTDLFFFLSFPPSIKRWLCGGAMVLWTKKVCCAQEINVSNMLIISDGGIHGYFFYQGKKVLRART